MYRRSWGPDHGCHGNTVVTFSAPPPSPTHPSSPRHLGQLFSHVKVQVRCLGRDQISLLSHVSRQVIGWLEIIRYLHCMFVIGQIWRQRSGFYISKCHRSGQNRLVTYNVLYHVMYIMYDTGELSQITGYGSVSLFLFLSPAYRLNRRSGVRLGAISRVGHPSGHKNFTYAWQCYHISKENYRFGGR